MVVYFLFLLSFISALLKQNEELYLSALLMSVDTNHKLGKKIKVGGGGVGDDDHNKLTLIPLYLTSNF